MFTYRSLVLKNRQILALWKQSSKLSASFSKRAFSAATEVTPVEEEKSLEDMTEEERLVLRSQKFGADLAFNSKKHGYILSFPWNFEEVIRDYEQDFTSLTPKSFWYKWVHNREVDRDFNELFRVFHQACAIPEESGIDRV